LSSRRSPHLGSPERLPEKLQAVMLGEAKHLVSTYSLRHLRFLGRFAPPE
jgi:hypothetical protein